MNPEQVASDGALEQFNLAQIRPKSLDVPATAPSALGQNRRMGRFHLVVLPGMPQR